ncbi:MAG: iron ABC transporter permease [Bacteroidaceae bacterium]|nr:iron ABC transporter permease [Bacteroidaceae bacterium]
MNKKRNISYSTILILVLCILTAILWVCNLFVGSVDIPAEEVVNALTGQPCAKESWRYIIIESRIPQAITALLAGCSLAVAGLLLQTTFNNPLAGPSILGIDTGAALGVAIVMLAGGSWVVGSGISGFFATILGAFLGAIAVLAVILFFSTFVRNNLMLLIIGMMVGYLTSSLISLLNFFASANQVHAYTMWGMGNLSGVSLEQLPWYSIASLCGLLIAFMLSKPLNAMLLGTRYAENLGVNISLTRNLLLLATGLLTATTTAFCGPITFIGLSVPHIARLLLRSSNHNTLLPVTMLCGAIVLLLCNMLSVIPGSNGIIPINAVTPLIGAPVIIYVIVNQKKINYFNG